jgi:hypothetical protein
MIWIVLIIAGILILLLTGCKFNPDSHFWKWQQVDTSTDRWKNYCEYMKKITSDSLLAVELQKKILVDGVWKRFYRWVSDWDLFHKLDYWDQPDEVWKRGTADCDGFARLVCDVLGRFAKYLDVWWLEVYGFYRKYYQDPNGDWHYKVVSGGHAICVYKRNGKLLAFSNTSWWNERNFQNFIEIGEQTFPEGIYLAVCRHWETGVMQWKKKAKPGEILMGTNIFHRKLKLMRNLKHQGRGEMRKEMM